MRCSKMILESEQNEIEHERLIKKSGKMKHASDCATSRAPAEEPGECDCDI